MIAIIIVILCLLLVWQILKIILKRSIIDNAVSYFIGFYALM